MLDIKFIRENPGLIREAARKKKLDFKVEELLGLDDRRRELVTEVEKMRAEQNRVSEAIVEADQKRRGILIQSMRTLKETLHDREEKLAGVMRDWQKLMLAVPNIPDISVPDGESDADNLEVRQVGEPRQFDFEPRSHLELLADLDLADLERGAKVSGFRGYFLKNDGVLLSMALWRLTLDFFIRQGYMPILAPAIVRRSAFMGTGYLPQGEEDLYKTQDEDYLSGTAEVPAMGYHAEEIFSPDDLPKKLIVFSPCYRREAGSHGKDTKGLMRVHEFYKLEQIILCEASHEESVKHHEAITGLAEELLQALELPYRVVLNCGADLGLGQVKKYDLEAWVPSEQTYRETHSASYFHDFQTRRLNIRYKDRNGVTRFAHSLNNTGLATPRILVSFLENHQQADGSIIIPKALQPYFGKEQIIKP